MFSCVGEVCVLVCDDDASSSKQCVSKRERIAKG